MTDVVCDLDGVIYRGDSLVPGADVGLRRLSSAGINVLFATNNSTRTPDQVAAKIHAVSGVGVERDQVVTSSQAAASTISPADGPVFIVGEAGIEEALGAAGIEIARSSESAGVVLVGLCRDLTYSLLSEAATAVRDGARFIATNTDPSIPTSEGLAPGAGAIVAAVSTASGKEPEVAGKPHAAMRDLLKTRVGSDVWVIGDRLDTDIEMASLESAWQSVLVLTGVTTQSEVGEHSDHVAADFGIAVDLVLDGSLRQ